MTNDLAPRERTRRFGWVLAIGLAVSAIAVPVAQANSDEDFARTIAVETAKFNEEIATKAAEMRSKGEVPKSGPLTAAAPSCKSQALLQPYRSFGDFADYTLIPSGSFEVGARSWILENESRLITTPNSPFSLAPGSKAISLTKGSKVTTSAVCVTSAHPTLRFSIRVKGSTRARLLVEVLYEDLGGSVNTMPIAYLKPSSSWAPTPIVPIHVNLRAAVAPSGTAAVAFRFTGEEDTATWTLDDVYVDPLRNR